MVKYKFKVGDKVKLKKGLVKYQVYGKLTLFNQMVFVGTRTIIRRSEFENTAYYHLRETEYNYNNEMLELVKVEDKELKFNEDQYTKGLTKEQVKQVEGFVFDIVKKDCVKA